MSELTKEQQAENKILLTKLVSIRNSFKVINELKDELEDVFSTNGLKGGSKEALELYSKDVNEKLSAVENHLKFLDSIYNQIPRLELTQDEKIAMVDELIVNAYIKGVKLTTDICEVQLGFIVGEDYLIDRIDTLRRDIHNEINAQMECDNINDEDSERLTSMLRNFDFTKYQYMNIEDLRKYLIVWAESTGENVRTDKLIEDKFERTCVGIYSVAKGGSSVYIA
ncbi:hypothetical protein BA195_10080 [Tenacibaculum soleae]|uniref:Uncharacterized protein n=1 Tax=Tenacibaculum soleae TaxID=447689 RepID=A0A1B9XY87_9FLAO|nr:hypothetical protein [Tenacibaculum soleae]OCK42514.1 hypothetical protein BA195_10080 [Tenacibaculum soleae]